MKQRFCFFTYTQFKHNSKCLIRFSLISLSSINESQYQAIEKIIFEAIINREENMTQVRFPITLTRIIKNTHRKSVSYCTKNFSGIIVISHTITIQVFISVNEKIKTFSPPMVASLHYFSYLPRKVSVISFFLGFF